MPRNVLRALVSFGLLLQTPYSQVPPGYHPHYVHERMRGEGKLWLGWSPEERVGFTRGYLWSYHMAYGQACLVSFELAPAQPSELRSLEDSPLQQCMLRELHYSKHSDYYTAKITAFYQKYPTDLDVPIPWLFLAFSDSENKTPEQIHLAWAHGTRP